MAEATPLQVPHQRDQISQPLLEGPPDHVSQALLQSPDSGRRIITMERGPRYRAYSELRESRLRMKRFGFGRQQEQEQEVVEDRDFKLTPVRKQVRFEPESENLRKGPSMAQSVPDFSTMKKENRKPSNKAFEITPPSKSMVRVNSFGANARGSKSTSAGEKKGARLTTGRSCANLDELKGLASAARNAINGGNGTSLARRKFI
ncbi:hypothetical protein SAY86_023291 [Trapa natans]|uniref:Uncharacterized protein n=1 Tax=Trapa natans TaxID=22666 RepID=A0AAN7RA22_TRANT|nr:hypothetical protein SAY86_023291 [Trapa natans]